MSASKKSICLVILFGLVSLFSDLTYEGARSILGPYLYTLGASAVTVGLAVGLGEFTGYTLRLLSGYLADRTRWYWGLAMTGYVLNLLAIPALAFVNSWSLAMMLIILERFGKALRTPARDTLLSVAAYPLGRGLGFGLHEALDQMGALLGPVLVFFILTFHENYRQAFLFLLIPAILALSSLLLAKRTFPVTHELKLKNEGPRMKGLPKPFWFYAFGMSLVAAGFVDFALIGFHLEREALFPKEWVPLLYALAMGVDAVSAILLGYLFDRSPEKSIILSLFLSLWAVPLIFLGDKWFIPLGMLLWGIGLAVQESLMRAYLSYLIPLERRAIAFGFFNTLFGVGWLVGSLLLGILYEISVVACILFSVNLQILGLTILIKLMRLIRGLNT